MDKLTALFKFSWAQAFSDHNGKSTVLPIAGFITIIIGGLGFLYSVIIKNLEITTQSVIMTGIGTSLLLGRKIVDGKPEELPFLKDDSKPE